MATKAYKYRLYPTAPQQVRLTQMLRDHCELYNAALEERRESWRRRQVTVTAAEQMRQLTGMRQARPDQAEWSFTSQQQTLRRLDKAFAAFFRRVKSGDKPGYPRFRSHTRFDSVDFRHGDGIRYTPVRDGWASLRVQGVGTVKVREHRPLPDGTRLGHVSVKREGTGKRARWFVVLVVTVEQEKLARTGSSVGIDLGVAHLATTSDGTHIPNPRHLHAAQEKLAAAQRDLARKKRGSQRRRRAVARVAALHAKVRRQRLDYAHKVALELVRNHDVLVLEDLKVSNMTRRPKPFPAPGGVFAPNGAAAKAGLNKSILDAGWGVFTSILIAKAECAGREVVLVNPAHTSVTCSSCGHRDSANRLSQAAFECVSCGHNAHADVNAAMNILRAGTAQRHALAA